MRMWAFFLVVGGATLIAAVLESNFPNRTKEPSSLCTYTRCPYYEAPLEQCRTYSLSIPKRLVNQFIQDDEEGLILASECIEEIH